MIGTSIHKNQRSLLPSAASPPPAFDAFAMIRPLKMRWILTCVAAGFLLAITPASGQDYVATPEEALAALARVRAEATRHAAERGDVDAQYNLGVMYAAGEGVPQDDVEAVRWYRLAAEQGDVDAHLALGLVYAAGEGVPQDDVEAVRWYRLAAEQG